jgi:predicted RecA/RadA family phage recombinase
MGLQIRSDSGQVFQTQFAATLATVAKVIHVHNALAWIPLNTELAGAVGEHVYQAEVSGVTKLAGEAWAVGQVLYWDNTNKRLTTTVGSNTKCGQALQPAAAPDVVSPLVLFNTFA